MKKSIAATAGLAVFVLVAWGLQASPEPRGATAEPAIATLQPATDSCLALPLDTPVPQGLGFNYPSCYFMHGTSCSSPGSHAFCQYNPFEPEICTCRSNHTWQCLY